MVMVPAVIVSGSDGVDIGAGSIGCASFDDFDDSDEMIMYMDIDYKRPTEAEIGIDRKHWRVLFTDSIPKASSRQEKIKLSLRLLAQVVGKQRALTSLYGVSNLGFGCQVSEEERLKFRFIDGVRWSFFDPYRRGPNGEYLLDVYMHRHPDQKFPGPDDVLSEYHKYLDDWEAEHGGCVFFPHNQQPVEVDPQESKVRRVRNTLLSTWQEDCKDGFTLVTSKKSNYIKKQVMEKEGNQATKEQVKLALEMHTLRKCAEQAVEQEARALEKQAKEYQALKKKVLEIQAKWKEEALEMQQQALEQEARAPEKQAKESLKKYKQTQAKARSNGGSQDEARSNRETKEA